MRKRTRILRLVFVLAVAVPLMPSFGLMTLREEAGQAATGVRISIQVSRPPGNAYPYRRMLTSQPHYFTEGAPGVVPSPPQIGGGRNGATEFRSRSAGFPQSIKVPRNASRRSRSPWLICPPPPLQLPAPALEIPQKVRIAVSVGVEAQVPTVAAAAQLRLGALAEACRNFRSLKPTPTRS